MFMWCRILVEGSEFNIKIHKKHFHLWEKFIRKLGSKKGPMRKANIRFDDLRKYLSSRTGKKCEGIFTSIAPDLLRGFQQHSRWNLIIQSKNYSCGLSSRHAIIFAAMISSSNTNVESQHWLYEGSTDQWPSGKTECITVCSALFCFCKWCWDNHWSRDCNKQGDWLLTVIPVCCLTWSSWVLLHML